ncbi:MAG: hypothetical protein KatS3mg082_2884 [Nitrospiraceae bacterium]|nr:MAG: hypothetical protein KatS3mg082_2884 [Nitrospiraceae bacterium]
MPGREDNRSDGTEKTPASYAGADHQEAEGGGPAAGRGPRRRPVAKELEVSEQTLHRWRAQYGGLEASDAKRLRELERENGRLKRMVADQLLEIDALKEIARGNW